MLRSHVIHLDDGDARAGLVRDLLLALPNAQVLPAADGRQMTPAERARACVSHRHVPHYPFPLLAGEVGCFLSHRRAWERIVAAPDPAGLIAEDDIVLDPEVFPRALRLAETLIAPDRILRFPLRDRERPGRVLARDGEIRAFRPRVVGLTTGLQIVGRGAAARLLELTAPFDRPVDSFLQMRWLTGLESLAIWPSGISSAAGESGGSTIQHRRGKAEELSRLWRRGRYRAAVARLSKRRP